MTPCKMSGAEYPTETGPLKMSVVCHPEGMPLRTKAAEVFPLLSRRERRQMIRDAEKKARKGAR